MIRHWLLIPLSCLASAGPADAAERSFTVTSFDRIRVEGAFAVTVTSNRGPSIRASGSPAALDEVVARVEGRTLLLRRSENGWGGYPGQTRGPIRIAVTVAQLGAASLTGSGSLAIDTMRGQRIDLVLDGSGRLDLARVETDRLTATLVGSGTVAVAGKVADARLTVRGSGTVEGADLSVSDAIVTADGAPTVHLSARRTASVQANGSGSISIAGRPACTVRNTGTGQVACGDGR